MNAAPLLADYLTPAALARELSVSLRTIHRWRCQRTGPKARRVGRRLLFKRSDVAAWLDRQGEPAGEGR